MSGIFSLVLGLGPEKNEESPKTKKKNGNSNIYAIHTPVAVQL